MINLNRNEYTSVNRRGVSGILHLSPLPVSHPSQGIVNKGFKTANNVEMFHLGCGPSGSEKDLVVVLWFSFGIRGGAETFETLLSVSIYFSTMIVTQRSVPGFCGHLLSPNPRPMYFHVG